MAWIGGLFLLWLGWRTLTARPPELPGGVEDAAAQVAGGTGAGTARAARRSRSLWMAWASTFLLTVTNPMTILSFAAVFAGLGLGSAARGPASAASLVAGVFLGSAVWWFALSGSVSLLKSRVRAGSLVWVNRISGIVLLGFGVAAILVASGRLG